MGGAPRTVIVLGLAGVIVSLYALHVENSMRADPFYEPSCVTRWGSCAKVFTSEYAHVLSHWGLVERHGDYDFSLASLGTVNYALYVLYPVWRYPPFLLVVSIGSCGFSLYLLYVLEFLLQDFCIVCTTFHAINFSMLFFGAVPEYRFYSKKQKKQ